MKYLILLALSACAQITPSSRIVAFGDSHTSGVSYQPATYMNYLSGSLNIPIDNQAMAGSYFNSPNQFGRIMNYEFKDSDSVVMLIGFNDASLKSDTDLDLFKTNLFTALNKISLRRVFVGTCIKVNVVKEYCDKYADATREIVRLFKNVVLVDTNLLKVAEDQLIDGVHFNLSVHKIISNIFMEAM